MWIERVLLLLLRVAIITLFGLAVARPYLSSSSLGASGASRVHRVILLDNTLSMAARDSEGSSRFDQAREAALRLLDSFPERDAVSLVTLAAPGQAIFDAPVYDRRLLRDQISAIEVTQRGGDASQALESTLRILRSSDFPAANRAVYLVSDLPHATWFGEGPSSPSAAMRALREVSGVVAGLQENVTVLHIGATQPPNAAVTQLLLDAPIVGLDLPVAVEAEVMNFSDEPARNVSLHIVRDGVIARTEVIPRIEPETAVRIRATMAFSQEGTHFVEARLAADADALPADNSRYLSIDVRAVTPVLLIDGRPLRGSAGGEAWFLATALAPGRTIVTRSGYPTAESMPAARISPLEPKVISESELRTEPLDEYRTVVLCNVGRLAPEQWTRLTRFVGDGGGLFVSVGDLVDNDNYNELGYAGGVGVLPAKFLASPVVAPESTGFRISSAVANHSIASAFVGHASSGLFTAQVNQFLPVEPDKGRSDIVLRYENGAPALVVGTFGSGRVAIWTTSVNLAWTNLPAKGDFIPLMYNIVAFVTPREGLRRNLTVGESLVEPLSAAKSALPIRTTGPAGAELASELTVQDKTYAVRVGPIDVAGLCELRVGTEKIVVAVNTDPRESDLRSIDERDFLAALGRPMRWLEGSASIGSESTRNRATEISFPLLYVVAGLLFAEAFVVRWLGSLERGGRAP